MERIPPEMTSLARHMRREHTEAEKTLWRHLCTVRPRFTRQFVVDRFIVDFACRKIGPAIEVDGETHAFREEKDTARSACLESKGRKLLRIQNADVMTNIEGVTETILAAVSRASTHPPTPSLTGRGR